MPGVQLQQPSCIVTIPISANAITPIQIRPRIRRSSSRCVATASASPTAPRADRAPDRARARARAGWTGRRPAAAGAEPRAPAAGWRCAEAG